MLIVNNFMIICHVTLIKTNKANLYNDENTIDAKINAEIINADYSQQIIIYQLIMLH